MENTGLKDRFREILIFVAGTTPQIITETIDAMIHQSSPIYPDEIYILTTLHGERIIKEKLFSAGIFKEFCKEFRLSEDLLNRNSIVVIPGGGDLLNDIKDWQDNESVGDFIASFIKDKASDNNARLHCSIAGGRKTMSFYLGSALQLFGRPWDKLYHVLVTPEFESNPDFYYKPKKDRILKKNGQKLHTKDAKIYLTELPFIRLANKLSFHGRRFKDLVKEGQKELDIATIQPQISINLLERTIYIGDNLIEMVPIQLIFYNAFLRQKAGHCKYPNRLYCLDCTDCFLTIVDLSTIHALEEMVKDYKKIYKLQPTRGDELLDKHKDGLSQEIIRQNLSKINRTIKEQLQNETLLPYYLITNVKKYAGTRYGVRVEKAKIKIESHQDV